MKAVARNEVLAVGVILLAATVLRIIDLNSGLWYDEAVTVTQFVRLPPAELAVTYGSLNNHVLYTWLAKASVAVLGEHPWSLRLPAVMFGVASIAAVWALFRESGFRWAAVAAAALLAVSFHHVWFSENARGYTGLLLFTTLAGLALHRALTTRDARDWVVYAACFAISMLIHLSAAFLLAAQGLAVLAHGVITMRRDGPQVASRWIVGPLIGFGVGSVLVLLPFIPMIGGMVGAFAHASGADDPVVKGVTEWKSPLWTAAFNQPN